MLIGPGNWVKLLETNGPTRVDINVPSGAKIRKQSEFTYLNICLSNVRTDKLHLNIDIMCIYQKEIEYFFSSNFLSTIFLMTALIDHLRFGDEPLSTLKLKYKHSVIS